MNKSKKAKTFFKKNANLFFSWKSQEMSLILSFEGE